MALGRPLRIGTRGSKLARWQSDWVAGQLRRLGVEVEIIEISTHGDLQQQGSVASLGVQGLFTKEIQAAVLDRRVDLAVHSLKDLPTQQSPGLYLAAVPPREDPSDALISRHGTPLRQLPRGASVGTGSLRRRAQIAHLRPDLNVVGVRGNVDTRLRKLDDGEYDAIVLAAAGLTRLGWRERITELLTPPEFLPAPGQGALGLECRSNAPELTRLVAMLDDPATRLSVTAERQLLGRLHGGCSAPIGAWGRYVEGTLILSGMVAEIDGKHVIRAHAELAIPAQSLDAATLSDAAADLGRSVADSLLAQNAATLIETARSAM